MGVSVIVMAAISPTDRTSERFSVTAQFQFPTPGARWLCQCSHVGLRNRPRRQHIKSLAALNDTAINHKVHYVNSLRTQLAGETLRESAHRKLPHCEYRGACKALDGRRCTGKEDTAMTFWQHPARRFLRRHECAQRGGLNRRR